MNDNGTELAVHGRRRTRKITYLTEIRNPSTTRVRHELLGVNKRRKAALYRRQFYPVLLLPLYEAGDFLGSQSHLPLLSSLLPKLGL